MPFYVADASKLRNCDFFEGTLSGLRQFLVTESPLKMIKNTYFSLKAPFLLKIFKFTSLFFGHVAKWLDFKICDVIAELTNNCNKHIDQYLKK